MNSKFFILPMLNSLEAQILNLLGFLTLPCQTESVGLFSTRIIFLPEKCRMGTLVPNFYCCVVT